MQTLGTNYLRDCDGNFPIPPPSWFPPFPPPQWGPFQFRIIFHFSSHSKSIVNLKSSLAPRHFLNKGNISLWAFAYHLSLLVAIFWYLYSAPSSFRILCSLSLSIILRFCQEFLRFELVFKCLNVFGIRKYSRTKSILLRLQISIINILQKILRLESIHFQTLNSDHWRYITNSSRRNKNQDANKWNLIYNISDPSCGYGIIELMVYFSINIKNSIFQ